jgi:integrase
MPRPRTGHAEWHEGRGVVGHWDIRPRDADGQRGPRECLAVGVSEDEARAECVRLEDTARKAGLRYAQPTATRANTFDVWCETKWLASRRDTKEADAHLRLHIYPVIVATNPDVRIMDLAIEEITKVHVETVVQRLDEKVQSAKISAKTAQNIWGTFSKLLDDATNAKKLEIRVLEANPAAGVRGPDRGDERQSAYLFPKEAVQFLACDTVPIHWRTAAAIAMFSGLRRGELAVLRVADVVLDGGYINVSKAADRTKKRGEVKSTKGKRARRVPIEANLRPLLERITKDRGGGDLLVRMPSHDNLAGNFRKWLTRAKVVRVELHASDEQRRPLNWHDLRHTFAVWLAMTGASTLTIQTRLGHADAQQLQRYVNEAEAVGHGDVGDPFPPLPASLLDDEKRLIPSNVPNRAKPANPGVTDGARTREELASPRSWKSPNDVGTNAVAEYTDSAARVAALEKAIVEATLAGRHDTAGLLADRLREHLAAEGRSNNVTAIGAARRPSPK